MATIKDIAKYTGVSPTTVSNVIHGRDNKVSPETKLKVKTALEELNYAANMGARLLANHGSRIIGMIIQDNEAVTEDFFDNPYHGELIQALESKIKKAGYFMMFHRVSNFDEGAKLADMWNLEGLIVSGTSSNDILKWQDRISVPIVFLDSYAVGKQTPFLNVGIDDRNGAYQMTKYLLQKGHEKIAFTAKGTSSDTWRGVDFERSEGVREAMEEVGLKVNFIAISPTYKNYKNFVSEILEPSIKEFTALFCSSDLLAVQIVSEFYKKGILVPRDISIVSFDGTPYSKYATPQITSMYQNVPEKAEKIIYLLLKAIKSKKNIAEKVELKTSLIKGESVKVLK